MAQQDTASLTLDFPDNRLAAELFGEHHRHLVRIEQALGAIVASRGNRATIDGSAETVAQTADVLKALYGRLESGEAVGMAEVDGALRMSEAGGSPNDGAKSTIVTRKRSIAPRSKNQGHYIDALYKNELVFGIGPAGTGKTYLAVAVAVEVMLEGRVDRIILSRPAVEAGERLGFLPGDMRDKVDPYLRPLYDALYDMLPGDQVTKKLESGEIEVAPLAFMRGRTLANSFVILDEAQNTTPVQMKMFLTRLGENGRMAVTGDPSQIDLPMGTKSGLTEALNILDGVKGVCEVMFGEKDVVRHPLVTRIVKAYNAHEKDLLQNRG